MKTLTGNYTNNPFDNSVVIIDEAHNFVSRVVNKLKQPKSISYRLYDYLMSATNAKIVFLTGTPIINYPNEIAVLYNMLRGYINSYVIPIKWEKKEKLNTDTIFNIMDKIIYLREWIKNMNVKDGVPLTIQDNYMDFF